jgi:hypothetical protein
MEAECAADKEVSVVKQNKKSLHTLSLLSFLDLK